MGASKVLLPPPYSLGASTSEYDLARGKLGRVVLDTNLLAPLLEPPGISAWLAKMLDGCLEKAVIRQSLTEYFSSPVAMRAADYDEVTKKLRKMGIKVLPGPLTTDRAGRIASEILQARYDSILAKKLRSKTLQDPLEATRKEWRKVITSSKVDVDLASEAFCKGFAFLTADNNFACSFAPELDERKMATHVVPNSWLKPPTMPIGSTS
ncbi:hypothetical protein TWF696_001753 [Orbilia brochopaga]|uniref:PIN domain-containing protein n=1 Tax=Orbilia brochopaga TaxID=3140254 RepID=A0AAV9UA43_9PEZI